MTNDTRKQQGHVTTAVATCKDRTTANSTWLRDAKITHLQTTAPREDHLQTTAHDYAQTPGGHATRDTLG